MSFMKKVAKIAAPFASLIPGIGPLVSMGLSAGLGALGSIPSKGKNKNQPQSIFSDPAFMGALTNSQAAGKQLMDTGSPLVASGSGYMNQGAGYFKDILQGGSSAGKALAGPISDLKQGNYNQLQQMYQMMPRGGAQTSLLSNNQFNLASGIAKLRYGAQNDAAGNLATIGNNQLSHGTSLMTGGANSIQDVLNTLLGRMGLQNQSAMASAQRKSDMFGGLGEGIGNILGILLGPGGMLNKSKSSGGSSGGTFGKGTIGGIFGKGGM